MATENITREELFARVWEKPASEVAADLGFSDVALGKLCKRLQVPKPPRGYWAKIQAGQKIKRPPLTAFRESLISRETQHASTQSFLHLMERQAEFFTRAINELTESGVDTTDIEIALKKVRSLSPYLAAQVLILVQNRYVKWVDEQGGSMRAHQGAFRSIQCLVEKLLPIADSQIVVFREERNTEYPHGELETILIRLTSELQRKISAMSQLVKDYHLSYTAAVLGLRDGVLTAKYVHMPGSYVLLDIELCVSRHEVWVRCNRVNKWQNNSFETAKMALKELLPVELIDANEIPLPATVKHSS